MGLPGLVKAQSDSLRFEVNATRYMMGTVVDATLISDNVTEARKDLYLAFREMERVEGVLSMFRDTSEIALLNKAAGIKPVHVSLETFQILERAQQWGEKLGGLFDLTIGAVTDLWGFSENQQSRVPPPDELRQAGNLINFRHLILDAADTTGFLTEKGMKVDLGGIAKGYAIDRAVAILHQRGRNDFLINAGGDIYISGEKAPGNAWRVGIRHPRKKNELLASLSMHDLAVVTSGDYERSFVADGKRYHHIIDPRTLYPATASQSVTVIASSAEDADVLATWLFISGGIRGTARIDVPDFIRVAADGSLQYDPALVDQFELKIDAN